MENLEPVASPVTAEASWDPSVSWEAQNIATAHVITSVAVNLLISRFHLGVDFMNWVSCLRHPFREHDLIMTFASAVLELQHFFHDEKLFFSLVVQPPVRYIRF